MPFNEPAAGTWDKAAMDVQGRSWPSWILSLFPCLPLCSQRSLEGVSVRPLPLFYHRAQQVMETELNGHLTRPLPATGSRCRSLSEAILLQNMREGAAEVWLQLPGDHHPPQPSPRHSEAGPLQPLDNSISLALHWPCTPDGAVGPCRNTPNFVRFG